MMLGVPVIATYAGGIPSLLQNNLEGILVQDGDSTALSAAIMEVLENPEKALEFGIESRKKALNRHDPKRIASETSRIYNALINETQNQNS
jgi:glycosyltransferase involved in cell wall biosynthesis